MNRHISILFLATLSISQISCLDKLGAKFPPLNTRKLKKKVQPTYEFSKVVMDYRAKNGFWPKSELDLIATDKKVINALYERGFTDWYLGTDSLDSLYIHFVHDPVSEGSHIGGVPIPTKNVKIKTLYIFSSGLITTKFDKE